jgi:hypothetical protein
MFNWSAVANHYREGGSGRVFEVLCARGLVPGWLLYYHDVSILKLRTLNPRAIRRRAAGYEYGAAEKRDVDGLVAISVGADAPALGRFFEAFFDAGNKCFVVRKDGAIVGYNWACHSKYTITNDNYQQRQLHLLLQPDEVLFGNGYIHPEYRLKGLFPDLVRVAVEGYPQGVSFYTSVARLNDLSVKSHERLGFEPLLSLGCHRLALLPYFWTVRAPDHPRRWAAWNQSSVQLSELVKRSGARAE